MSDDGDDHIVLLFVWICLLIGSAAVLGALVPDAGRCALCFRAGIVWKYLFRIFERLRIPYTCALFVVGLLVGSLDRFDATNSFSISILRLRFALANRV